MTLIAATLLALSAAVAQSKPAPPAAQGPSQPAAGVGLPTDYVIGVEDELTVVFYREKELTTEVVVRPDGKISVPMLNDIQAAGLTPEQLMDVVTKAATKFIRDPGVTIIVRGIKSRKVYVIGEVTSPGPKPLASEMTVLQVIGEAGGFLEHAKKDDVTIVRMVSGKEQRFKFNYNDVVRGRKTEQNIRLLPGDIVLVR